MITIVDITHWLEEDGSLPAQAPLRTAAIRVAQCIEAGGPLARGEARETLVACRRRPGGRACVDLLVVLKEESDAILAFCPDCDADEYLISGWQSTRWAGGPMAPVDMTALQDASDRLEPEAAEPEAPVSGLDARLADALADIGSRLTPAEVRRIVQQSDMPSAAIGKVMASTARPPSRSSVERFFAVLVEVWNTTSRAELGGRTPAMAYAGGPKAAPPAPRAAPPVAPQFASIGRNQPCPCGSGKKYKKCCLLAARH